MEKDNCLFCKIIKENKDLIYQDQDTAAFLDIFPIEKGHILVVPKKHYNTWLETSPNDIAASNITVQKIAKNLLKIFPNQIKGFNIITNNGKEAHQMIFHYHIHLIPKFNVNQGFKVLHETNIQARDSLNETRTLLQEKLK